MSSVSYDNTATYVVTHTTYDSTGRAMGTQRYQAGQIGIQSDPAASSFETAVAPDAAGLTAVGNQLSATSTTYDGAGRVSTTTAADGTTTETQYTTTGAVLRTRTDPKPGSGTPTPDWTTSESDYKQIDIVKIGGVAKSGDVFSLDIVPTAGGNSCTPSVTASTNGESPNTLLAELAYAINSAGTDGFTALACDGYLVLTAASPAATFTVTTSVTNQSGSTATLTDSSHTALGTHNSWTIDALGHVTVTDDDNLGRAIQTTYNDGSFTQTIYGREGLTVPDYDPENWGSSTLRAIDGTETVTIAQRKSGDPIVATEDFYNESGGLTDVYEPAVADALNSGTMNRPHWVYGYDQDGNEITQVDAKDNTTHFAYDQSGNKISQLLPDGEKQTWSYDAYGNQTLHKVYGQTSGVTNSTASQTTWDVYSTASDGTGGRLLGEYRYISDFTPTANTLSYADTTSYAEKTLYAYDSLGRSSSVTDYTQSDGVVAQTTFTNTTYDSITGKEASIATPDGTIHYVYDPATGWLVETWTGVSHSAAQNDILYGYDGEGRLASVGQKVVNGVIASGATPTTLYAYDGAGNLLTVSDPNGMVTTYSYDDLNRLTDETVSNTTTLEPIFAEHVDLYNNGLREDEIDTRYNGNGSVFSKTQANWNYDNDERLTEESLAVLQGSGTGVPTAYDDKFYYDQSNNRTEEDINGGDGVSGGQSIRYSYDNDDQLKTETETAYASPTSTTQVYQTQYTYDADGNLSTQTRTGSGATSSTYSYDLRNQMITSVTDGVETDYTYDTSGALASQITAGGGGIYYLNDPNNPTGYTKAIQTSTSLNGAPNTSYVLGLKVEAQSNSSNGTIYLLTDGHGSTRAVTTSSGVVLQTYDYDAFGTALGFNAAAAATTWLFGGDGFYDPATDWTNHLNRWTDGFWFTQSDPTRGNDSDPISLHKYLYANADPIMYDDPSGHDGELAGLLTTIGGIAGLIASYAIPVVEAATPYLSALTLVTAFADPQAMEDFIATGGDPAALVGDLVNLPGLVADDARDLLVFGRGLLQDAKVLGVGGEEVRALQGAVNNVGGNLFQEDVQSSLGLLKGNETVYPTSTPRGPVNVQPDLPVGKLYGVTDVKDVVNITATDQIRGFGALAKQSDPPLPFSLIISPRTQSISGSVLDQIRRSNGIVAQFDSSTNTWTQITLPGSGGWRR